VRAQKRLVVIVVVVVTAEKSRPPKKRAVRARQSCIRRSSQMIPRESFAPKKV
jgi:hypothetical protein